MNSFLPNMVFLSLVVFQFQSPLGLTVGNSLEVEESLACLRGGGPPDLRELVIFLEMTMVSMGMLMRFFCLPQRGGPRHFMIMIMIMMRKYTTTSKNSHFGDPSPLKIRQNSLLIFSCQPSRRIPIVWCMGALYRPGEFC